MCSNFECGTLTCTSETCEIRLCDTVIPPINDEVCNGQICKCSQENGENACNGNPCQNGGTCSRNTLTHNTQASFIMNFDNFRVLLMDSKVSITYRL